MMHAPAATKKNNNSKGPVSYASWNKRQEKKHLRGEWNTVVDGYQAVEHERCFFSAQGVSKSRPFKLAMVINGFAERTYELAESIGIGILVDGR
jgi:hypothetical protein